MSEKRYELIERFIAYGKGKPQFTGYSLRVDGKEHDLKEVADRLNEQAETIEKLKSLPPTLPPVSPSLPRIWSRGSGITASRKIGPDSARPRKICGWAGKPARC